MLCVVDDAQWLDDESADILSFVARRLLADRIGMLFAIRETTEPDPRLQALPGLRIAGLPEQDAYELLETSISRPIDAGVAARIIAETDGNPLAVVEAARELTPEQLGGRAPLPEPLPVGHQLEVAVRAARAGSAPGHADAAVAGGGGPAGPGRSLWRAAAALGIPESAAVPAEAAGLVAFWPEVRFSHPLVRSAIYHGAPRSSGGRPTAPSPRPAIHELDAVSRAWHLAAAAAGPDEEVAAELEAAADRARSRGGYAAAAAFLERAALLTPDAGAAGRATAVGSAGPPARGGGRPGRRPAGRGHPGLARSAVDRAGHPTGGEDPVRPRAAWPRPPPSWSMRHDACGRSTRAPRRDALLSALEAAVYAGWAPAPPSCTRSRGPRVTCPPPGPPDSATDLLLQGYTARVTGGYAAAVPALRRAVQAFLADEVDPDVALPRFQLVALAAVDLLDDASVERLTTHWMDHARESGALAKLAGALGFRSALVDGPGGRLAAARAAEAEAHELAEATDNPGVVPPIGRRTHCPSWS